MLFLRLIQLFGGTVCQLNGSVTLFISGPDLCYDTGARLYGGYRLNGSILVEYLGHAYFFTN